MKRRVLVVDDHPLAREALAVTIRGRWPTSPIDVAGSLAEIDALLQRQGEYRLAVLDLMLPDAKGFSALLMVLKSLPGVPAVIISARQDAQTIATARLLGASGFVPKSSGLDVIADALARVVAGEEVFASPASLEPAPAGLVDVSRRLAGLSGAQLKVLVALADGRLNKQIAADMQITEATVKAHLTAIFRKLGVDNRTQAVLAARPLLSTGELKDGG